MVTTGTLKRRLFAYQAAGAAGTFVLSHYFADPGSRIPAVVWIVIAIAGVAFGVRGLLYAFADLTHLDARSINGPIRVYAAENIRREYVRLLAHLLMLSLGVVALLPAEMTAAWFGEYFTACLVYVQFSLVLNSALDAPVRARMREAAEKEESAPKKSKAKGGTK